MKVFEFEVYILDGASFFTTVELSDRTIYNGVEKLMKRTIRKGVFDPKDQSFYPYHAINRIRLVKETTK